MYRIMIITIIHFTRHEIFYMVYFNSSQVNTGKQTMRTPSYINVSWKWVRVHKKVR